MCPVRFVTRTRSDVPSAPANASRAAARRSISRARRAPSRIASVCSCVRGVLVATLTGDRGHVAGLARVGPRRVERGGGRGVVFGEVRRPLRGAADRLEAGGQAGVVTHPEGVPGARLPLAVGALHDAVRVGRIGERRVRAQRGRVLPSAVGSQRPDRGVAHVMASPAQVARSMVLGGDELVTRCGVVVWTPLGGPGIDDVLGAAVEAFNLPCLGVGPVGFPARADERPPFGRGRTRRSGWSGPRASPPACGSAGRGPRRRRCRVSSPA